MKEYWTLLMAISAANEMIMCFCLPVCLCGELHLLTYI